MEREWEAGMGMGVQDGDGNGIQDRGNRGSEVLEEVLGKGYAGIVSCDFWGAYKKYAVKIVPLTLIQFCWAHLIREIVFLAENGDKKASGYGKRLLGEVKKM
jgi:hypothetical protein